MKDIFEEYVSPIVQDLAVKSTERGSDPIIRALYYADPLDANTFSVDDQFMLGAGLMIAPVVEPMQSGESVSTRSIYLPTGNWVELTLCSLDELMNDSSKCEKQHQSNGKFVDIQVSLDNCPIFKLIN